jgi:predicted RNA-binding protein with PUA-like domain
MPPLTPKNYWLVKQEPTAYSWDQFTREKGTVWSGVRNFQARNHLRQMAKGDLVLFYHSGESKEVVGIARVQRPAYPDPTATEGDWSAVDLNPVKPLKQPVPLNLIKSDSSLAEVAFLRQTRLSVTPLTPSQFGRLLELGKTEI